MDGVIVASDQTLEWILPWWLKHFQKYNNYPVAFVDLGLSYEMKTWCKKNGMYIPLRVVDFADQIAEGLREVWKKESGTQFEDARNAWFKKPLALMKSPFEKTIWLDVDCEIKGNLAPLFEYANQFAIAKEQASYSTQYPQYNTGVIAYRRNHPLVQEWANWCQTKSQIFRGDQDVFANLVHEKGVKLVELPEIFNWSRLNQENPNALIQHWHGNHGKFVIRSRL